ncbi:MAG TPA: response regulator [candidate division Zixibacteria bacterium]|nr:response regulator [candidate division Zixibacteria bacterium]
MSADTKTITALIVDDEPPARRLLRKLLGNHSEFEVIGECADGAAAIGAIGKHRPQVVFLDVQMPEVDGFSVLEALDPGNLPYIVFVTAYDQYAVKAFEAHALDYLLKPFTKERFAECLAHVRETLERDQLAVQQAKALSLAQSHAEETGAIEAPEPLTELVIREGQRVTMVRVADVLWFGAANQYVDAHTAVRTYVLSESLNGLQAKLDPEKFFRIHRSAIVNVDAVSEIRAAEHGAFTVALNSGARLTLSRRRRDLLLELLRRRPG